MKNFYRIMVVVGMLFVATGCFAGVTQDSSELVLTLSSTRDGRPVYAVYSKKFKHIFLRLPELSTKAGEGVDFLQRQVESLIFKTGQRTKLSDGYVLVFDGGYPVWGPYHELTKEGEFVCLQFSEKVSLKGKEIHFKGMASREGRYYPYNR